MDEAHMEEFDLVAEKQATIEKELMELKQDLDLKKDDEELEEYSLRNRGLCLIPMEHACASDIPKSNIKSKTNSSNSRK
ncbi:unnamed protein product [Brassica rapa]|uniref:Uncharacterized protein n=1 Tax=Brassica campestris TaxID=3711 RepID=A0A8D9DG78_BRACM|nr:unnamed protein product [Brassica rapa]